KKHAKQYQNDNQAEDSQFLADDGKNHIILRLRNDHFLGAVSKTFSKKASASDCQKSLHRLKCSALGILFRIYPGKDSLKPEIAAGLQKSSKDLACNQPPDYNYKKSNRNFLRPWICYKKDDCCNSKYDNRSTQILRQDEYTCCGKSSIQKYPERPFFRISLFSKRAYDIRDKQNHGDFGHLGRLQLLPERKLNPSSRPVCLNSQR